jgi:murein DD-endopeptidase MepM/ murein hydrolase activator NlpD
MPRIILAAHGRITTHFREDIGRGFLHNGIDQGHGDGTPYDLEIRAPADGLIVSVGKQGTYGNRYIIRHDDG